MAAEKINYTPVEWDTTKSLGPTNFNHMDNGIKKACDGVDELQDEVDEINGKITPIKQKIDDAGIVKDLPFNTDHTVVQSQYTQVGNTITIKFNMKFTSDVNGWTRIGMFQGIKSRSSNYFPIIYIASYVIGYIDTNGGLAIGANAKTGQDLYGTFTIII